MKSFLLKNNTPIIKWGLLSDDVFYEGQIPEGYDLAVNPHQPYVIVDVDRHEDKDGFEHISSEIKSELEQSFYYHTKRNGIHYWLYYTGNKTLINRASNLGIDLRIGNKQISSTEWINGGYVKWHPGNTLDIRDQIHLIKETSEKMNEWLEKLFS